MSHDPHPKWPCWIIRVRVTVQQIRNHNVVPRICNFVRYLSLPQANWKQTKRSNAKMSWGRTQLRDKVFVLLALINRFDRRSKHEINLCTAYFQILQTCLPQLWCSETCKSWSADIIRQKTEENLWDTPFIHPPPHPPQKKNSIYDWLLSLRASTNAI